MLSRTLGLPFYFLSGWVKNALKDDFNICGLVEHLVG